MNSIARVKTLIIVPAFNEAGNIGAAVAALQAEDPLWHILVVNDGSTDTTSAVARESGKAMVVDLPCNLGIGGAVQTGFKYAQRNDYTYAVKFDGDGQHKAEEVSHLLQMVVAQQADVVIGSRFLDNSPGYKSTRFRRLGIRLFEVINSLLVGQRITDNTSGFRAYNRKAITFLAQHYPSFDYPEPEEVILLARNGFAIREISVEMQKRLHGKSSISTSLSFYYIVKVVLAVLMTAVRPRIRQE